MEKALFSGVMLIKRVKTFVNRYMHSRNTYLLIRSVAPSTVFAGDQSDFNIEYFIYIALNRLILLKEPIMRYIALEKINK